MGRFFLAIAFVVPLSLACSCSPGYILQAGWEEANILLNREPIEKLIKSPETKPELQQKLALVVEARAFAARAGLTPGESYTEYSEVSRDVLVWVLSGADKTSLTPVTWWFPIVGSVPYKGFFDKKDGLAEARALSEDGFDIYLRPSAAFSTLGWFDDPLLSTLIAFDDVSLVNTVIHEILHNTVWVKDHAPFNETLANIVGMVGAIQFFTEREGNTSVRAQIARDRLHDELMFARLLAELEKKLKTLYESAEKQGDSQEQILHRREQLFSWAKEKWQADAPFRTTNLYEQSTERLNNAVVIANKIYLDRPWLFTELLAHCEQGLSCMVQEIQGLSSSGTVPDPYQALEQRLKALRQTA